MSKRKHYEISIEKITILLLIVAVIICGSIINDIHKKEVLAKQSQLIAFTYPYATNTYDWGYLQSNDIYMKYEDTSYTSSQGIDVSSHQGDIDWQKVAGAGIQFAFVRAAYRGYESGDFYADDKFDANMQGANSYGIDAGIYVFSQAVTVEEAAEEADFAISSARKYKVDLPIVFDMEGSVNGDTCRVMDITAEQRSQMAVTFMNRVKDAGYEAMYYGSTNLLEGLFDLQYLQTYPLWLAEYDADSPAYSYQFDYWQYSCSAEVPGIEGHETDMDIRFVKKS